MIRFPVLRWGEPYESLETEEIVHFATGEPVAEISRANPGIVARDLRRAQEARRALRAFTPSELVQMAQYAGELYMRAELPLGNTTQSPDDFVRQQSATTGLPEAMCRANMGKLHFVLANLDRVMASLTRGLDLDILANGFGEENGIMRSFQAQTPVLGMVLPSNSPGVHTLWMPVLPLHVALAMKPGSQEPWTTWRMAQALFAAGVPREAISLYPGGAEVGAAVVNHCPRSMVFGGQSTIDQYAANPGVQVHGPGYSKILLGEDRVDDWESYLDVLVESVLLNGGRSCINASGIWAPRHGREIAEAIGARLAQVTVRAHDDPQAELAAFTAKGQAPAISADIDAGLAVPGAEEITARLRGGDRLIEHERYGYLLPTLVHCAGPEHPLANKEYMFPFAAVVDCPQEAMLGAIGHSLVVTAITDDAAFQRQLLDAPYIDRLNFGAVPTTKLDWLQPHEGNIVDFLYRARSFQKA